MTPDHMRAVVLTGHGGLDRLELRTDWPVPVPGPTEVLIRVSSCGLNNTDVNTRVGWYSSEVTGGTGEDARMARAADSSWGGKAITFPRIQGADVVGTVVAAGTGADSSLVGKRVMTDNWLRDWNNPHVLASAGYFGSERDGGFADYTVIDHRNVGVVETDLSDAELATFSCSYTTAEGMLERVGLKADERVLITGASGGVGSALVQLARRRGACAIGMASESKHERLCEIGTDAVLPRSPAKLRSQLGAATGASSVDVVADVVGGTGWAQLLDVLRPGGRYVCSGAIAGPVVPLDLRKLYLKDLTFHGSTVVPPRIFRNLIGYIERGEIRPLLAATYPLEQFHAAQTAFLSKKHVGKIAILL